MAGPNAKRKRGGETEGRGGRESIPVGQRRGEREQEMGGRLHEGAGMYRGKRPVAATYASSADLFLDLPSRDFLVSGCRPSAKRVRRRVTRCCAKRRHVSRKWLTVSGSRQVWHRPESTAPKRARYALRPTCPVRICVMMLHWPRCRSSYQRSVRWPGGVLSKSAKRVPTRDVDHASPHLRAIWCLCDAFMAAMLVGRSCRTWSVLGSSEDSPCAALFASASTASFPSTSRWPGIHAMWSLNVRRFRRRSRRVLWN
ncbi:hypothetical protein B0H10DRAFT_2119983, partial [Mycena sp. CBHHK59/15]